MIGAAIKVAKIATGEIEEETKPDDGKDKAAQELGRKGNRLAAFAPEGMETGSGAGRALFFVRCGCGLHRPTQRKGLSAAIPRVASLPRGVTKSRQHLPG